jgi:hypothetical protein
MAVRGRTSAGPGGQDETTRARNEYGRARHERNSGAPSPLRSSDFYVQVAVEMGTGLNWDYIPTGAASAMAMVALFACFRSLCTKQTLKFFMRYE